MFAENIIATSRFFHSTHDRLRCREEVSSMEKLIWPGKGNLVRNFNPLKERRSNVHENDIESFFSHSLPFLFAVYAQEIWSEKIHIKLTDSISYNLKR